MLERALAEHFAQLALRAIAREYPNQIAHVLTCAEDARPPRELTPIFYGAYDWHSAVHGHWALIRTLHCYPTTPLANACLEFLKKSFTEDKIAAEKRYLEAKGRAGFELPYGLAWMLALDAELYEWPHDCAAAYRQLLTPIVGVARQRILRWAQMLPWPVRTGIHSQSAFALGLSLDWARVVGDEEAVEILNKNVLRLYANARRAPLHLEPSAFDFLSPTLSEADLMRRVLEAEAFSSWLSGWLEELPRHPDPDWLVPVACPNPGDPRISHLQGLNLSRAWMLFGIAESLPAGDPRCTALRQAGDSHTHTGLDAVTGEHYAGAHWQGSFALYLGTGRGLRKELPDVLVNYALPTRT